MVCTDWLDFASSHSFYVQNATGVSGKGMGKGEKPWEMVNSLVYLGAFFMGCFVGIYHGRDRSLLYFSFSVAFSLVSLARFSLTSCLLPRVKLTPLIACSAFYPFPLVAYV